MATISVVSEPFSILNEFILTSSRWGRAVLLPPCTAGELWHRWSDWPKVTHEIWQNRDLTHHLLNPRLSNLTTGPSCRVQGAPCKWWLLENIFHQKGQWLDLTHRNISPYTPIANCKGSCDFLNQIRVLPVLLLINICLGHLPESSEQNLPLLSSF